MSVDVKIVARAAVKNRLTLQTMLDFGFHAGTHDSDGHFIQLSATDSSSHFVLYDPGWIDDPASIGRGIYVTWKRPYVVKLSLSLPAEQPLIHAFYTFIAYLCRYWETDTYEQDYIPQHLSDIDNMEAEICRFSKACCR